MEPFVSAPDEQSEPKWTVPDEEVPEPKILRNNLWWMIFCEILSGPHKISSG